jgi:hypothetical protein
MQEGDARKARADCPARFTGYGPRLPHLAANRVAEQNHVVDQQVHEILTERDVFVARRDALLLHSRLRALTDHSPYCYIQPPK